MAGPKKGGRAGGGKRSTRVEGKALSHGRASTRVKKKKKREELSGGERYADRYRSRVGGGCKSSTKEKGKN